MTEKSGKAEAVENFRFVRKVTLDYWPPHLTALAMSQSVSPSASVPTTAPAAPTMEKLLRIAHRHRDDLAAKDRP